MYPDQPQQSPQQTPYDYLNQIAPQAPKKSLFHLGLRQVILLGAALVLVVIIFAVIINAAVAGKGSSLEHLSVRLANTGTIADSSQVNLKSSKLRNLNSNLRIYITNTNRDIAAPLKLAGIDSKKINANVVSQESTKALAARLEDARLNAVFDKAYAREMAYQLGNTMTLMTKAYNSTKSTSTKTFLSAAYDSLKPTQEGFANFSTAN